MPDTTMCWCHKVSYNCVHEAAVWSMYSMRLWLNYYCAPREKTCPVVKSFCQGLAFYTFHLILSHPHGVIILEGFNRLYKVLKWHSDELEPFPFPSHFSLSHSLVLWPLWELKVTATIEAGFTTLDWALVPLSPAPSASNYRFFIPSNP